MPRMSQKLENLALQHLMMSLLTKDLGNLGSLKRGREMEGDIRFFCNCNFQLIGVKKEFSTGEKNLLYKSKHQSKDIINYNFS